MSSANRDRVPWGMTLKILILCGRVRMGSRTLTWITPLAVAWSREEPPERYQEGMDNYPDKSGFLIKSVLILAWIRGEKGGQTFLTFLKMLWTSTDGIQNSEQHGSSSQIERWDNIGPFRKPFFEGLKRLWVVRKLANCTLTFSISLDSVTVWLLGRNFRGHALSALCDVEQ